jgi:hypothetical protein
MRAWPVMLLAAPIVALLLSGAATSATQSLPAAKSGQSGTPPIPSGFKLVASDRGNKASYWTAEADVFSVDNPVAIDIRVAGTGKKPSTHADVGCSDDQFDTLSEPKRVFTGFGLFTMPVPAGATNCGVTVTATGASGAFTIQVYVQTGAPTTPTPTSPTEAYDGTWQGRIQGTIYGGNTSLPYSDSCCDVWSFTVSDGKISGDDGTSGSISSTGAATIAITSEHNRGGAWSIGCTFQVQFTSTSASGGPISCEADAYTLTGNFSASPKTTQAPAPPTTTPPKAGTPYCVKSNDGSSNGWNYYKYVDTTSTAPCYGHWNITLGPRCNFDDGDGHGSYSSGPANVWNIVRWGYYGSGSGGTVAYLHDGRRLVWSCTINVASYAQTSLNSSDGV